MDNKFELAAKKQQEAWLLKNGYATVKGFPYILMDETLNLFEGIRDEALSYFAVNRIKWQGDNDENPRGLPTGKTYSSQIACLNHLFQFRNDPTALRAVVSNIDSRFTDVLPVCCDKTGPTYVAFEVVSKEDHLNEGEPKRGEYCTSIDALICAKDCEGKVWLIPIEWKFTEDGSTKDYSNEDREGEPKGKNGKGLERLKRYGGLIDGSEYVGPLEGNKPLEGVAGGKYYGSVLFRGDLYQLLRQTLWAEQMIACKEAIVLDGDSLVPVADFYHLHVIPEGNVSMRGENGELESAWRDCLTDSGNARYKIISPQSLIAPLSADPTLSEKYSSLLTFLRGRYW